MVPRAPGSRRRLSPTPLLIFAIAASLAPSPAARSDSGPREVELVLSRMTFVSSEEGEPDMVLFAERARIPADGDIVHLGDVSLETAGESGEASLVMTCDRARFDLATGDFTADGNVRGRTADGHRFKTPSASFAHDSRVIESHTNVDIIDPSSTRLEGKGFRYDVRSQRMRVRDAVVSEFSEELSP